MYDNVFIAVNNLQKVPPQSAGTCCIYFAKIEDVITWPEVNPLTGIIDSPFELKTGGVVYSIKALEKGKIFTENQKASAAGPYFEQTVSIPLGGDDQGSLLITQTMLFYQYLVIVKERNSIMRLVGGPDAGAKLQQMTYSSGDIDNPRKRAFQFYFESVNEAPIYFAAIPGISSGPSSSANIEFSDEFSTEFN